MHVIRQVQARQAHAVPKTIGRSRGPFPDEIFEEPEIINPYSPEPENWLYCSVCGGRELEVNIEFHICYEDDDDDDA